MRKSSKYTAGGVCFGLLAVFLTGAPRAAAAGPDATQASPYTAISDSLVQKAEADVDRVAVLVGSGALSQSQLKQAQDRLADARDEALLSRTLYANKRIEDMRDQDAAAMVDAAKRRVDRQKARLASREQLVVMGILAKSDLAAEQEELNSRYRVLELANYRVQLLADLHRMADAEDKFQQAAHNAMARNVMIRFDGNGAFQISELSKISAQYQRHFQTPLPVSALGQTFVHQAMGLDHRNRVDVGLNPDSAQGMWLRTLLERMNVPYLAFRTAVAGAATAPHIHIGTGSNRLKVAHVSRNAG